MAEALSLYFASKKRISANPLDTLLANFSEFLHEEKYVGPFPFKSFLDKITDMILSNRMYYSDTRKFKISRATGEVITNAYYKLPNSYNVITALLFIQKLLIDYKLTFIKPDMLHSDSYGKVTSFALIKIRKEEADNTGRCSPIDPIYSYELLELDDYPQADGLLLCLVSFNPLSTI